MSQPSYVVITPARDEEQYLPLMIASMCAQTHKPLCWIIVDDGSKDSTGRLIDEAAAAHPWIKVIHRRDRGARQAGGGVIASFYDGYALVVEESWDYVVKFDGDLSFEPDYFANCLREFEADKQLGIAGGTCCKLLNGEVVPEFTGEPKFHVRGPTKIYRRECFEAIGGLMVAPGWDTIDQIKANMLGWKTVTFQDIRLIHHRPTGGAYGSWNDLVKNGLANYVAGYHPLFMICKCLSRLFSKPVGLQSAGLFWGFFKGYFKNVAQVQDRAVISYLRNQQWRALTLRNNIWRR